MDWMELILPIVREVILVVVLVIAGAAVKFWRGWAVEQWIKELVEDGVFFAKEKFWDRTGVEKFQQAKLFILDRLAERGIHVSEEWIDGLIDSIVGRFREEWEADYFVIEE